MDLPLDATRFELRRVLGSGANGVVYEAFDRERGGLVAVKTLHHLDPAGLLRLKHEFRGLADIAHPNLASLYELTTHGDQWLLVMELIDGVPFLEWVRGAVDPDVETPADATYDVTPAMAPTRGADPTLTPTPAHGSAPPDIDRLRDAFRQLAVAVSALHAAERLHRDLKPSNVLVTASGRVVVLDFGLISDTNAAATSTISGTAAYMSPEQAAKRRLGPASDWYAVGTMLFEALTGLRPFTGTLVRLLVQKQLLDAPAPHDVADGIPADLGALCSALLRREPDARPTGDEVLARLGGEAPIGFRRAAMVGRESELGALRGAWEQARTRPVLARVRGRSGLGKTTLVEHFLGEVDARVLVGRCYERESVPYKALDSLVDRLVDDLHHAPELPPGTDALAQLFPVLRRVPAIAALPPSTIQDAHQRREAAFAALVAVIESLSPVVVFVDDAQWGDADSASLFVRLSRSRAGLLVLLAWRDDDADTPLLNALHAGIEGSGVATVTVDLGALGTADAVRLARDLLPEGERDAAERIAAEGRGNPLFVHELTQRRASSGGAAATSEVGAVVDLDEAIRWRAARLPERARALLDQVAVSGRPTPVRLLESIAEGQVAADLALLRASRFVRTSGALVAPFHDRVREAIVAGLGRRLPEVHRALAEAWTAQGGADDELLGQHWLAAGERDVARPMLIRAAERSADAMAFAHAAQLYRLALDADAPALRLQVRLGEMLAYDGRGREAADVWLAAAAGADRHEAVDLLRMAGEQLLIAGQVERGLAVFGEAHDKVGLRMPGSGVRALPEILFRTLWIRLRGTRFTPRLGAMDAMTAQQIDLSYAGVSGLVYLDTFRSAAFQVRQLSFSLAAGDPARVARSLSHEGSFAAVTGGRTGRERSARCLAQAREILGGLREPELDALEAYCRCVALFFSDRPREALEVAVEAEALYRRNSAHVAWQLLRVLIMQTWMTTWIGHYDRTDEIVQRVLTEARRVGNEHAIAAVISEAAWMVDLARDRAEAGMAAIEALRTFPADSVQEFGKRNARAQLRLYQGDGDGALRELDALNRQFRRLMLSAMLNTRAMVDMAEARAHLLVAERATERRTALAAARRLARAFMREGGLASPGHAALVEGRVLELEGHTLAATAQYQIAIGVFEPLGWSGHVQALQWRLGTCEGGADGARRIAEAEAALRSEGAVRPDRMAAYYVGAPPPA